MSHFRDVYCCLGLLVWLAASAAGTSALAPSSDCLQSRALDKVDGAAIIRAMLDRQRAGAARLPHRVVRTFEAENLRFRKRARMVVETWMGAAGAVHSQVMSIEGSQTIQKRVFRKILEAEAEAVPRFEESSIRPENYRFQFEKLDCWAGRENYVFRISPIRKHKFSVEGSVWIDRTDLQIARIAGTPAKRPSFWTLRVNIDKQYRKQRALWLPEKLLSESSIFLAGKSALQITYAYPGLADPAP
jgi:hypothetical protein